MHRLANLLQSTAAASERVFEFLEEEEEVQIVENAVSIDGLEGKLILKMSTLDITQTRL
uniref:ABC transporter n=1 Tax=Clostridioides difficile TaxID=1496 RepID=A0A381ICP8_CLODI|nr:ABC transporter [Clostridioides difficile]